MTTPERLALGVRAADLAQIPPAGGSRASRPLSVAATALRADTLKHEFLSSRRN